MGVIDGHDVRALRRALREALAAERPVVVHCATVKGKGFAPAEEGGLEGMEKWHAAKPKSIAGRRPRRRRRRRRAPRPAPPAYTQVFGEALVAEAERDERVIGITAAMNSGTGLYILQKALPDRYYDVGIAEQQAILFAARPGAAGRSPVAAIYSTFLQRAFDQIVHDVCLQKLNVVFAMDRAGLVGDDGPTHHGVFDIAYLRPLPNIVLMAPRDEAMLVHMLHTALRTTTADRAALPARRGRRRASCRRRPSRSRSAPARSCARASAVALRGLRHRRRQGARGRRHPRRARARGDGRRRPLRQADRRRPGRPAGRRARAAGHRRGGRAGRRLRLGGVGDAVRDRARRCRASCASACPTATSPTARRSCCTRRSASPASGSPSGSRPRSPTAQLTLAARPESPAADRYRVGPCARVRLDALLSERGLFPSRTRAAASVLAGEVMLGSGDRRAEKPGQLVDRRVDVGGRRGAAVRLTRRLKLANALDAFGRRGRRPSLPRRRRLHRRLHRLPAQARRRARDRARRRLRPAGLAAAPRSAGDRDRARQRPRARAARRCPTRRR